MSTPHNSAERGDFAKTVLMPGDPLRAKFIAETFLEDAKLVNSVRNMLGYTGYYNGKRVSVMAHGMGIPSIGIYSYELYKFYDVENIIRIGSTGGYVPELKLFDTVLATAAYSESTYALYQCGDTRDILYPSAELNERIRQTAAKLNIPITEGIVHSSDVFYGEDSSRNDYIINERKCVCAEMESFALFSNANVLGKKAACLLSVSDSFVYDEITTPEQRQTSFTNMMKIALEAAEE
ncbi:MAG: purine-nucleoside phosphorylase [Solobacterium sp.]|nr:purine-nucleoside phosphorylase [Solobacterium sp.]